MIWFSCRAMLLTRLGNADTNVTSTKALTIVLQSLLQRVQAVKLDVTETFGLILEVLHDTDAVDL